MRPVLLAAAVLLAASAAGAAARAPAAQASLRPIDRVSGPARPVLAGDAVVWSVRTSARGVRLRAASAATGSISTTFGLDAPKGASVTLQDLASSATRTAFVAATNRISNGRLLAQDAYAGRPGGPFGKVTSPGATPLEAFASSDSALFREVAQTGQRIREGDATFALPAEVGGATVRVAGPFVAFQGARRLEVLDRRDGAAVVALAGRARGFDLDPSGRLVALLDRDLVESAPGRAAPRTISRDLDGDLVRIAGERTVVRTFENESAERLTVVEADGTTRPLGPPSASLSSFEANATRVAWQANGCILTAALTGAVASVVPPGRCARQEAVVVPGRPVTPDRRGRIRLTVACVSAPRACTGRAVLKIRGRVAGSGHFRGIRAGRTGEVRIRVARRAGCRGSHSVAIGTTSQPAQLTRCRR